MAKWAWIGLDPGATSALATMVRDGDRLLVRSTVGGINSWGLREVMAKGALATLLEYDPVLVTEQPQGKPFIVRGLAESIGRWLEVFERLGLPKSRVRRVAPTEWRKGLFGKGRFKDRDTGKQFALDYVRERYGIEGVTDDEAEAVCLAEWGARRFGV